MYIAALLSTPFKLSPSLHLRPPMDAASEILKDFQFVKRKRSKRKRILLPSAAAASSTSCTESNVTGGEVDEDMANCLILLAQGRSPGPPEKLTSRRFTEAATTTGGRAGFYVYECKTCSKCFSSFQALGGHRASHKRPKLPAPEATEEKKPISLQISLNSSSVKPALFPRIHECSVCGSEFSSGQALGGHMRRHRPVAVPESRDGKRERQNFLSLDLNLPAPSDEALGLSFGDNTPMILGALVDCHY